MNDCCLDDFALRIRCEGTEEARAIATDDGLARPARAEGTFGVEISIHVLGSVLENQEITNTPDKQDKSRTKTQEKCSKLSFSMLEVTEAQQCKHAYRRVD